MARFKYFLGWLWVFPVSLLIWIFFCIPAWIAGQVERVEWSSEDFLIWWQFKLDSWLVYKYGHKWAGNCLGCNIIDICLQPIGVEHEQAHGYQQYRWGVFFFPAYIVESIIIYAFTKKNPYVDNHFERGARKAAGQPDPQIDERIPW